MVYTYMDISHSVWYHIKENAAILRKWEKLEKKIADFQNHRRFTLRCLSQNITPTSIKLKSNVKIPQEAKIIKRVEKQLMNERVRFINSNMTFAVHRRIYVRMNLKIL